MSIASMITVLAVCWPLDTASAQKPSAEVRIELSRPTMLVGENQSITVRIRNTSDRDLTLDGFNIGYQLPRIEYRKDAGPWKRLRRAASSDSDYRPAPVELKNQQEIVRNILLFQHLMARNGFDGPGAYDLRPSIPVHSFDPRTKAIQEVVWSNPVVSITVEAPSGKDKLAYDALLEYARTSRERMKLPTMDRHNRTIGLCRGFLQQYASTPYARDMRVELKAQTGMLIDDSLRLYWKAGVSNPATQPSIVQARQELADVLEEIAAQGGPYAREALPELVDTYLSIDNDRAFQKARQAADRWVELEPDNPRAVWRRSTIEGGAPQSRPSTQPGGG